MNQKKVFMGASMFVGASAFGIGSAISDYVYPKITTFQSLITQLAILSILFIISWYYQGKASKELDT